jgi:hypothetical protein
VLILELCQEDIFLMLAEAWTGYLHRGAGIIGLRTGVPVTVASSRILFNKYRRI